MNNNTFEEFWQGNNDTDMSDNSTFLINSLQSRCQPRWSLSSIEEDSDSDS